MREEVCPAHTALEFATAVTVGLGFTFTDTVFVFEQPELLYPVTVYTVVEAGLTETAAVVAPVFQLYVVAPPAVSVEVCPEHIALALATAVTVGFGLTLMAMVFVFEHPEPL